MSTSNSIFPAERREEGDQEIGFNEADLCRAVEVWYHAQGGNHTVGEAAMIFNVTPGFLASVIDRQGNPYFFASQHDRTEERMLDCDGA